MSRIMVSESIRHIEEVCVTKQQKQTIQISMLELYSNLTF